MKRSSHVCLLESGGAGRGRRMYAFLWACLVPPSLENMYAYFVRKAIAPTRLLMPTKIF